MLLNECYGISDLLSSIFLNVILSVTEWSSKLEYRDSILLLKTLGDYTVTKK